MTARPAGSLVRLYYDSPRRVTAGDYLRTATTGRLYLVHRVRVQDRGKHKGRQHIVGIVMRPDHEVEADARVLPIQWYPRTAAARSGR